MEIQDVFMKVLIYLATGVLMALAGFLIALVTKGFDFLRAKIGLVKDERVRKSLDQLNSLLENIVYNTVVSLQQTLGDEIKESIATGDGKYTREDLLALKDKAVQAVYNQLKKEDWTALDEIYTDLTSHIEELIEVNVYQLKNSSILTSQVLAD